MNIEKKRTGGLAIDSIRYFTISGKISLVNHKGLAIMKILEPLTPEQVSRFLAEGAALRSLTVSTSNSSQSLDKFATWFLTAFGVGLTFLLTNYKDLEPLIPVPQIKTAASLFVCAVAFGVIQRYLAAIISGIAASARDGYELGKDFSEVDWDEFINAFRKALPFPLKFILRSKLNSMEKREILGSANTITWLTLIQGVMVVGQSVELLRALATIFPKS